MSRRDWISYQPISSRTSPIIRSWIPYGRRTTDRTNRLIGLGRVSLTSQRENFGRKFDHSVMDAARSADNQSDDS